MLGDQFGEEDELGDQFDRVRFSWSLHLPAVDDRMDEPVARQVY